MHTAIHCVKQEKQSISVRDLGSPKFWQPKNSLCYKFSPRVIFFFKLWNDFSPIMFCSETCNGFQFHDTTCLYIDTSTTSPIAIPASTGCDDCLTYFKAGNASSVLTWTTQISSQSFPSFGNASESK